MSTGVAVLGSTGSVGTTTLRVVRHLGRNAFRVVGLAAGKRMEVLEEQIREFDPLLVSVQSPEDAGRLRQKFPRLDVMQGPAGNVAVATMGEAHIVMAAIVGAAGLEPTYRAVLLGKRVALANKEALVMAGRFVMDAARRHGAELLPVDSEHCAVFQCLRGESVSHVRKILLTASGGSLRNHPMESLASATVDEVLNHPTWKMGRKITVDSATMMNKGLEIIEAHHLFQVNLGRIDVLLHPQSLVHSLVEFEDGSMMAQLAVTDMALPVQYSLTYPARMPGTLQFLDLAACTDLSFSHPDPLRFPCMGLARRAAETSEEHVIALNAANEVAVEAFLGGRIAYGEIAAVIEGVLEGTEGTRLGAFEEVFERDGWARELAWRLVGEHSRISGC
jgi:1-deoxy-D-xylulose-5-phosphate reductoisomerase